jgi:DNA-binding NtrC family response regulator
MIYQAALKRAGFEVVTCGTASDGQAAFGRLRSNIVLLDLMLPDRTGLEVMRDLLAEAPTTCVIVITANGSINKAVAAMRAGAHEFLVKPIDEQRFLNAVQNAVTDAHTDTADTPETRPETPPPGEFIGASVVMGQVYDKIRSVARSMATVFITGESGTGKELCAQAVHDLSNRRNGPFVPLNCGAIPSELLESEVFGHVKGSFTGAISDKPGAAASADGGTLFLDEICELDLNLQTKLLRFLQTSTIQPVGATRPRKVNVRIVCATNRDPLQAVRRGQFREDLYYRLHVVPIHMPPLRERGEDVNVIATEALLRFAREEGRAFTTLGEDVRALFRDLDWPGNVRQLLNAIRHVVVLNDGPVVTRAMLPADLLETMTAQATAPAPGTPEPMTLDGLVGRPLAEVERMLIEATIALHGGSIPKAARVLDVSPSTLYRKIESWRGAGKA